MLRLKAASSMPEDFTTGTFRPVLPDTRQLDGGVVTRVILASGKVVWELEAEREKRGDSATAILRVEQLAPIPAAAVSYTHLDVYKRQTQDRSRARAT